MCRWLVAAYNAVRNKRSAYYANEPVADGIGLEVGLHGNEASVSGRDKKEGLLGIVGAV